MDAAVVREYLHFIDEHCSNFYVKNPLGKYFDHALDGHFRGKEVVKIALQTGILREIIDINDSKDIVRSVKKYVKAYRPGPKWSCSGNDWARPWSYYWQALYQKI
jgi:hypothetical protein